MTSPVGSPAVARLAYDHKKFAFATRPWAEPPANDPKLADDRPTQHRYNTASAASVAATGPGRDAVSAFEDTAEGAERE